LKRFLDYAQAVLSERVTLPSFSKQDDAPTDFRSAYSGRSPSPYGALDSGAWQRERKDLSRSSPRNDLIAPPSAGSSSVQRSIDEADKSAAASATNTIAAQSLAAEVSPAPPAAIDLNTPAPQHISDKEIERKDLSRSPPPSNDADGVIPTQVVPAVSGYSRAVLDYKTALTKYFPGETSDYVSFEAYIVAKLLVEALRRVGPQLDTEKLIETLEGIHDLDMGLGTPLNFGASEHQASHKVWGTQLDKSGHFIAIDLE
jgi:hypothetical protein